MKSSLEPYQNLKVNALYEWNKNVLLLGVDKIGFSFYDKKVGKNTGYKEISKYNELFKQWPGNVQFIFKHPSKKELWFGTQFGGLIICQLKDREISSCQYYLHHLGKTKIGSCINSIISDKDGNIWIGSDEGLNIITTNNDTLSYDTYNRIQCIYQDHTGTVWLGTSLMGYTVWHQDPMCIKLRSEYMVSPGIASRGRGRARGGHRQCSLYFEDEVAHPAGNRQTLMG